MKPSLSFQITIPGQTGPDYKRRQNLRDETISKFRDIKQTGWLSHHLVHQSVQSIRLYRENEPKKLAPVVEGAVRSIKRGSIRGRKAIPSLLVPSDHLLPAVQGMGGNHLMLRWTHAKKTIYLLFATPGGIRTLRFALARCGAGYTNCHLDDQ